MFVKGKPSIQQALWGKTSEESTTSMHMHNWWIRDDAAHKDLERLVIIWNTWKLDVGLQVQLISFISVFNGRHVQHDSDVRVVLGGTIMA